MLKVCVKNTRFRVIIQWKQHYIEDSSKPNSQASERNPYFTCFVVQSIYINLWRVLDHWADKKEAFFPVEIAGFSVKINNQAAYSILATISWHACIELPRHGIRPFTSIEYIICKRRYIMFFSHRIVSLFIDLNVFWVLLLLWMMLYCAPMQCVLCIHSPLFTYIVASLFRLYGTQKCGQLFM